MRSRFASPAPAPAAPKLGFVPPLLPKLVFDPPAGDGWLQEVKHDGYRTLLLVEGGSAKALTRNGHDWTARYPRPVERAAALPCSAAILDGEMIVQDARGVSDFAALVQALGRAPERIVYCVFDLLHLDGRDLRGLPLADRKVMLRELLEREPSDGPIQYTEGTEGDGAALFPADRADGA